MGQNQSLNREDVNRVIEMAWEDRTPFEAIEMQFDLAEKEVIELMRCNLKPSSWRKWRAHVQGRATKHLKKRGFALGRHRSDRHRPISQNNISKRKKRV